MKLMGYQRENGHFGVRNHVLIIPTSVCATDTAEKIAAQVPGRSPSPTSTAAAKSAPTWPSPSKPL